MTNHAFPGYRPSKWADPDDLIVRHRHGAPKDAILRMREQESYAELDAADESFEMAKANLPIPILVSTAT